MPKINRETLAGLTIPLPPDLEQYAIVEMLECETFKIDTLVAKTQQVITLLREHRTALIAAAVTGQIDVRGAVKTQQIESEALAGVAR